MHSSRWTTGVGYWSFANSKLIIIPKSLHNIKQRWSQWWIPRGRWRVDVYEFLHNKTFEHFGSPQRPRWSGWKSFNKFIDTTLNWLILHSTDVDMNFLLFQALKTISTLPFHLTQDTWRWDMFRGDIPVEQLNDRYWADKYVFVSMSYYSYT